MATKTTTTPTQLASLYLRAIGAPDTPLMRRVMLAWFKAEGGFGGRGVADNNPLNIAGYAGPCGVNNSTHHAFPVFCTPEQGANAFAQRLSINNYGYPKILAGFRSGDPTKALVAIITSGWVTGNTGLKQYQYTVNAHHYNSLVNAYNSIGNPDIQYGTILGIIDASGNTSSTGGTGTTSTTGQIPSFIANIPGFLTATGRKPTDPITQADADAYAQWYHDHIATFTDVNENKMISNAWVGKTWTDVINKPINWPNVDPVTNIANALAEPTRILEMFVNPANWAKILAILAGGGLIIIGGWLIIKDTTGGESRGLVNPLPIIVRE